MELIIIYAMMQQKVELIIIYAMMQQLYMHENYFSTTRGAGGFSLWRL